MSVTPHVCSCASLHFSIQGFLPVLYSWLRTRTLNHSSPVQLQSDRELHDANKLAPSSEHLTGWKVLLLWIPAFCDLTGTTVGLDPSKILFLITSYS